MTRTGRPKWAKKILQIKSTLFPFFSLLRHPRMGDAAKNPFVLPIFDTNYTVDLVWPADDTIDTSALNQKVHTIDMAHFQEKCNNKLDVIVRCGQIDPKREDGLNHFSRAAAMPADKVIDIANMNEITLPDGTPGPISITEYPCMGIVYGKKCLPDQMAWLKSFKEISDNYLRPKTMRAVADKFIERKLKGQPYLAVHWRYESDWLDMCKPSRPKGARERNGAICELVNGLDVDQASGLGQSFGQQNQILYGRKSKKLEF